MTEHEKSCLDIPEQERDPEAIAAEAAKNKSIPQFCNDLMTEIKSCEVTPDEVKHGVNTLAQIVQHMYMLIQARAQAEHELLGVLNIVLRPAPTQETAPTETLN